MAAAELRQRLAEEFDADRTCPTSLGISLRIVAEAACDELEAGRPASQVAPFWRVIGPEDALAQKLRCGPDFLRRQRRAEGIAS